MWREEFVFIVGVFFFPVTLGPSSCCQFCHRHPRLKLMVHADPLPAMTCLLVSVRLWPMTLWATVILFTHCYVQLWPMTLPSAIILSACCYVQLWPMTLSFPAIIILSTHCYVQLWPMTLATTVVLSVVMCTAVTNDFACEGHLVHHLFVHLWPMTLPASVIFFTLSFGEVIFRSSALEKVVWFCDCQYMQREITMCWSFFLVLSPLCKMTWISWCLRSVFCLCWK